MSCNAQTANFVLSAVALGNGRWGELLYYFIPMTAYFLGAFISESVLNYIKGHLRVRWDTLFLLVEMLAHCRMRFAFVAGGTKAAVLCRYLLGKALLFTLFPLGYLFVDLLLEDIHSEKSCLARKPAGH